MHSCVGSISRAQDSLNWQKGRISKEQRKHGARNEKWHFEGYLYRTAAIAWSTTFMCEVDLGNTPSHKKLNATQILFSNWQLSSAEYYRWCEFYKLRQIVVVFGWGTLPNAATHTAIMLFSLRKKGFRPCLLLLFR